MRGAALTFTKQFKYDIVFIFFNNALGERMRKIFALLVLLFCLGPPFASTSYANNEFDDALFYYFNNEPELALKRLDELEILLQDDSIFYEYRARCYWQLAKKSVKEAPLSLDIDSQFIENIDKAIKISEKKFNKNKSPENAYDLAMALSTKAGYLAQIYGGKEGAKQSALLMDRAVEKIKFCITYSPPYCLAYLPLGITQFFITKEIGGSYERRLGYWLWASRHASSLYDTINYDKEEAIRFVEIASRCVGPDFRRTEALITLQLFLMGPESNQDKRYEYDLRALPILQELTKKYPNNEFIKNNLSIVYRHMAIKNKSR